jgi:hypothetical protein
VSDMSYLAGYMGDVASMLLGDPNKAMSSAREKRFGKNGSLAVDLQKGTAFDHEAQAGGGVLWLIERELGIKGRDAFNWLSEHGFKVEDDQPRRVNGANGHHSPKPSGDHGRKDAPNRKIVATYDYRDREGNLIYEVVRLEWDEDGKRKKTFRQRRPDPGRPGDWIWNLDGVEHSLYRLPEAVETIMNGYSLFLVEGEKDVETLHAWGVPATTNSGGAKHWSERHAKMLAGGDIVVIPDNDDVGREGARLKAKSLKGVARNVRILDLAKHAPELPQKGDITDWRDVCGGTVDQLYDLVEKTREWREGDDYKPRLKLSLWSDLEKTAEPHEWLIKNLLTRGELAMLAGASQAGKTFLTLDLSMAIARGTEFLGHRVRRGGVVYQAGEGVRGLRSKRLPAYRTHYDLRAEDNLPFALIGSPIDIYSSDDDVGALISDARYAASHWSVPLELVIIDTWAAATPGANENASEDVSRALRRCERIRQDLGCTVLLVHHMNADGTKARGHTSLGANVDSVIINRLLPDAHDAKARNVRELEVFKLKDGEAGRRTKFVLQRVELGTDEDGDAITSCIVAPPEDFNEDGGGNGKAIRLLPREQELLRAIEWCLAEYGVAAKDVGGLKIASSARVVKHGYVKQRFMEKTFEVDPDEADAAKLNNAVDQAIKRAGQKLVQLGLIDREGKFYWRTEKSLSGTSDRPSNGKSDTASGSAEPLPGNDPNGEEVLW